MLFIHEKESCFGTCGHIGDSEKHTFIWKKQDTKSHMLYDSFYMTYPEQVNLCRQKGQQWFPGAGGKENLFIELYNFIELYSWNMDYVVGYRNLYLPGKYSLRKNI